MCWGSCPDLLSSPMVEPAIFYMEKHLRMEFRDQWQWLMYDQLPPKRHEM